MIDRGVKLGFHQPECERHHERDVCICDGTEPTVDPLDVDPLLDRLDDDIAEWEVPAVVSDREVLTSSQWLRGQWHVRCDVCGHVFTSLSHNQAVSECHEHVEVEHMTVWAEGGGDG